MYFHKDELWPALRSPPHSFINGWLSVARCSAYLHIKQARGEMPVLLWPDINQFKASFSSSSLSTTSSSSSSSLLLSSPRPSSLRLGCSYSNGSSTQSQWHGPIPCRSGRSIESDIGVPQRMYPFFNYHCRGQYFFMPATAATTLLLLLLPPPSSPLIYFYLAIMKRQIKE